MITTPDFAELSRKQGIGCHLALLPLDQIDGYLDRFPPREAWDQRLVRHCQCCGERPAYIENMGIVRCAKHAGRNPCLIEGCGRTFKAHSDWRGFWYSNDQVICGAHWRALIPPASSERRVLQRINRLAKRIGWTDQLYERESRIWRRIVATARSRAAGDLDEAEINRLMGWDKAA